MSDVNWLVYHKYDQETPVDFGEVLWHEDYLLRRTGKLFTWGEAEVKEYPDRAALGTARADISKALEDDGFQLVRQWSFDPSEFDYALLARELAVATTDTVTNWIGDHPGMNAFSIATDDDYMTILPIGHEFDSIAAADDDVLMNPDYWDLWRPEMAFDIPFRLILSRFRDYKLPSGFRQDLSDQDRTEFRAKFTEACVTALEHLDSQSVFQDPDRVLLFHVTDPVHPNPEPVKRLNSPDFFKRWKAIWYPEG